MSTLLSGTSRVVLTPVHGVRLEPVELAIRARVLAQMRPLGSPTAASSPPSGREAPAAAARREILAYQPVEFHAPCGYGKTTLLRYLASGAVWAPAVYVRVGSAPLDDVLQMIFDQLFTAPEPVKPTRAECEQLIRGCRTLVVLDDVPPGSRIPRHLTTMLTGYGHLVTGSVGPALTGLGQSWTLPGLPADAALDLYTRSLGRRIGESELADVQRLLAVLDGQPLHIKQAAALVRAGEFTASRLSQEAEADSEALDRLSLSRLNDAKRRALTVLALFAGALLPAALVSGVGDIAFVVQHLGQLHQDGLAEHPDDRFGIPVCKKESYQQQLLGHIDFAAAVRGLVDWLADPTGPQAREGLEAALSLLGFASDRAQFAVMVRLIRLIEPVLFVLGRWKQWRHVLGQGIEAARQSADASAEAFFAHQKGTLAYCENRLQEAQDLLERAVTLRSRHGDHTGSALSREHLRLAQAASGEPSPHPNGQPNRRGRRTKAQALKAALLTVVGAVAIVAAVEGITSAGSGSHGSSGGNSVDSSVGGLIGGSGSSGSSGSSDTADTTGSKGASSAGEQGEPSAESTPSKLDFPDTSTLARSAPKTLTLTSTGTKALTVFKATLDGAAPQDFEITEENCAAKQLAPKGDCRLEFVFRPTATGSRTAELTITDNTDDGGRTIPLSGVGTTPPDLVPVINEISAGDDVAPPTLKFTVENRSDGFAAPTTTSVTVMKRGRSVIPDIMQKTDAIQPGSSTEISVDIPDCNPETVCDYIVMANVDKAIEESDETNNKATWPPGPVKPSSPVG